MNTKAQEYIIKELNFLYEKFTAIQIRYEFNEGLNVHFVEVLPLEVYDTQNYILEEMRISEKFEEMFGDKEELLFISEDSLNCIENPTYTLGYITESYEFKSIIKPNKISFKVQTDNNLEEMGNSNLIYAIAA